MSFYITGDGQVLSDERPYVGPDGTKYPAGWLQGLEPVGLMALGLEPYEPPEPPEPTPEELLAAAQAAGIDEVNTAIGQARLAYVTEIPAQQMLYLEKQAEAKAYLAEDPEPVTFEDYPLIYAEIGITASTAFELSQIWLNMAELWREVAAGLESLRLGTIGQIEAAEDAAAVASILSSFHASLGGE